MDGLIAYALSKKYADEVGRSIADVGFKTQVEQDRSILQTAGQEKILYFIPKITAKPSDGYDEYIYSNNAWEQVGATDVDLNLSAQVNQNGTITFFDENGDPIFTTTGESVIGPKGDTGAAGAKGDKGDKGDTGNDYVLTPQDKADIADIVLQELPTTQGVLYGNASN